MNPRTYRPASMPRNIFNPFAIPAVHPISGVMGSPLGVEPDRGDSRLPAPLYNISRQGLSDVVQGMDDSTMGALAQAVATASRRGEEDIISGFYREPFTYAVYVGAQGIQGAAIAAGATAQAGQNRIEMEASSNFETYFATRWAQDTVTGLINNARSFRSRTTYAGSRGVTGKDETSPNITDQFRNQNAWGSAQLPKRYIWPLVLPASSTVEIELTNDEANAANFQLALFGEKAYCGRNPRQTIVKPPFRREPFTFGISFNAVAANIQVTANVQMLQSADFELLYITQDSNTGNVGDFEAQIKEGDGGNKALSNILIRRDAGWGTVEQPSILTYPRYYVRGSRIIVDLINRNFAAAAQSFQLSFTGNLLV